MRRIRLAGIYKIEHLPTGMLYIGMSTDIFSRWGGHWHDYKMNKHSSTDLVNLLNSTPITEWAYIILEQLSLTEFRASSGLKGAALKNAFRTELLRMEKLWMAKHSVNLALNNNRKHFS